MKRTTGGRLLHQSRYDTAQSALKTHSRSHEMSFPDELNAQVAVLSHPFWATSVSPSLSIVWRNIYYSHRSQAVLDIISN